MCAPIFLAHITRFLEARCLQEPGTRISTRFLSPFCLLPKVSHANVHWAITNCTFSSHIISLNWHFLAWRKPLLSQRSTARARNPQGISNLVNQGWLLLVWWQLLDNSPSALGTWLHSSRFLALCSIRLCRPSLQKNSLQRIPQQTLAIWYVSQSQSQGTSHLQSTVVPNCLEVQWVLNAWVGADCSTSLSCGHLDLQVSWGFCSWGRVRAEYAWSDTWRYSVWDFSSNVISSPFQFHFCS